MLGLPLVVAFPLSTHRGNVPHFVVYMRRVIHEGYEIEVDADNVVEAMDKAEASMKIEYEPDYVYADEGKWAPIKVSEIKE